MFNQKFNQNYQTPNQNQTSDQELSQKFSQNQTPDQKFNQKFNKKLNENRIAVISSGNGGQTMAAYFANMGYSVSLYVREEERATMFPKDKVFRLRGLVRGDPVVDLISHDMKTVTTNAHLIMVTTPAQYHHIIAREMASCLEDGQIIILNPGRSFGTYVFEKMLSQYNCQAKVIIAETDTFVFACRCEKVAEPYIHGFKKRLNVAAHKKNDTPTVAKVLSLKFPNIVRPVASTVYTSFSNIGLVFHPLPFLLNITRAERRERFFIYAEGITPLVADMLERLDAERVAVARAFGADVLPAFDWLKEHYGAEGGSLYERIQNTEAYMKIIAPVDLYSRYIFEDIPTGLVPISFAGKAIGCATPVIDSAIAWAGSIYGMDFRKDGRNDEMIDFGALITPPTYYPAPGFTPESSTEATPERSF